jgi:hypothetical protein
MHSAAGAHFDAAVGLLVQARPEKKFNAILSIDVVFALGGWRGNNVSVLTIERKYETVGLPETQERVSRSPVRRTGGL